MAKVRVRVEHALGQAGALQRLQTAAQSFQTSPQARAVRSLEWNGASARARGEGFEGTLTVGDTDVTAEAELGFALSFFPLKIEKEAEAWLKRLLA